MSIFTGSWEISSVPVVAGWPSLIVQIFSFEIPEPKTNASFSASVIFRRRRRANSLRLSCLRSKPRAIRRVVTSSSVIRRPRAISASVFSFKYFLSAQSIASTGGVGVGVMTFFLGIFCTIPCGNSKGWWVGGDNRGMDFYSLLAKERRGWGWGSYFRLLIITYYITK